ncbi:MAG: hypothetical protein U9Q04_07155 [Campylobacterota bacterium]|nr:hypothetical protein [Campylobacterota bacterium]
MDNIENILKKAHSLFTAKEYDKALFLYSQVLSTDPLSKEYQLYGIFCDIGSESDEKAQSLFEYFIVSKDIDFDEAVKYVEDVIEANDGDNNKMMGLLKDISSSNVESLNAIEYKDFMSLVESRGSFKEAYQDIMFSTKVAITTKEELLDFINRLIDNNFRHTAYNYLDGFNEFFEYDNELSNLYEKLERAEVDTNTKQ